MSNQIEIAEKAQDIITQFIALTVYKSKPDLVALLRKNGVVVPNGVSDRDLIGMTYVAIAKSPSFKNDLVNYGKLVHQRSGTQKLNASGDDDSDKTAAGKLLQSVATPENINALMNLGLGIISKKLTAKADQKSIQDATSLAVAQTQQKLAEAKAAEAKAKAKKWVVPVVIGASILAVVIIVVIIKNKK